LSRWRDVKKGKVTPPKPKREVPNQQQAPIKKGEIVYVPTRLKAFAVDMFMIMMPIMYIITYILLDGKEEFQANTIAHWVGTFSYGFVVTIFWAVKKQTPGMKSQDIIVVDKDTKEKLSFGQAFWRYLAFLFSATIVLGLLFPFFRQDKKTLHDIMSNSVLIHDK
jgi:uncharacterized RDD family membrane protein YckC